MNNILNLDFHVTLEVFTFARSVDFLIYLQLKIGAMIDRLLFFAWMIYLTALIKDIIHLFLHL